MPAVSHRTKVILAMLTMYIVWGTTYLGIKMGIDAGLPPTLFAGIRQIPAAAILFALAAWRGTSLKISPRDLRISAVVGILLICGGQYFTFLAEETVSSGISALVVALIPLWIALAETAFPDMQRPGKLGWLGLATGFVGLGILLWPRLVDMSSGSGELIGIAIQVVGGWLWAAGSIYSKRRPVKTDSMVMTAYEMLTAGCVLILLGSLLGEWPALHFTPKGFVAMAYLAVFGSAIAFSAFTFALKNLSASKVMTYAYVNPVIAVFAGALAGHLGFVPPEPITAITIIGMVVIVAGVALATTAPPRPPRGALSAAAQSGSEGQSSVETGPSEV